MKFKSDRPFADPELAARKIIELANAVEPVQDAAFTSRRSTGRSYFSSRARRPNIRPGSIWRSQGLAGDT